jgi:hypothetical protein
MCLEMAVVYVKELSNARAVKSQDRQCIGRVSKRGLGVKEQESTTSHPYNSDNNSVG